MKLRTLKHILLSGGVSCLAFSDPAYATLKEALEAVDDQDYGFALEELNRLASKEENVEALYHLGRMYENGYGVEKDEEKALEFYQQAADKENDKAALKIGNAYYTGKGRGKDYQEAFKWYTASAQKGNYSAQYNIGLMYEDGTGVKADTVKAFESYKKSGNQGYAPAQIALGRMFLKGIGTPQDYTRSIFWYKLAADQGNFDAMMSLAKLYSNTSVRGLPFNISGAHIYFNIIAAYGPSPMKEEAATKRDELTKTMKNEDVAMAQSKANRWKKKKREESLPSMVSDGLIDDGGNPNAGIKKEANAEEEKEIKITTQTDIKEILVAAGISRRDLNKAIRSDDFSEIETALKQKSEEGEDVAKLALADLYVLGQGLKENPQEAFKLYSDLAQKNNAIAFYRLTPMYCEGTGVNPDLAECYKMIMLAKKFSDDDSLDSIMETVRVLDENLDKDIRDAGKKLADEWGQKKEETKKKKGFFSFGGNSDDDKKEEKKKAPDKKETEKKPADDEEEEDDLFSGL